MKLLAAVTLTTLPRYPAISGPTRSGPPAPPHIYACTVFKVTVRCGFVARCPSPPRSRTVTAPSETAGPKDHLLRALYRPRDMVTTR
ncbi:Hypothetical protein MexAM1_META2p1138 (plasmid) [Methylorubrum extorquens AM1]|uniref:Uncharacterized protein n=1 Tax=Methylorubrum extorquens (strain ATCC 14718 / DSM 1338 / JCM 2805 / NCIMB 9133 / AM1) TaxID=272630 RepID=C5B628_METEA|nr:Hypothetical protein MexAM1_META2p1138 [Methylorubrum extorquens AM1]